MEDTCWSPGRQLYVQESSSGIGALNVHGKRTRDDHRRQPQAEDSAERRAAKLTRREALQRAVISAFDSAIGLITRTTSQRPPIFSDDSDNASTNSKNNETADLTRHEGQEVGSHDMCIAGSTTAMDVAGSEHGTSRAAAGVLPTIRLSDPYPGVLMHKIKREIAHGPTAKQIATRSAATQTETIDPKTPMNENVEKVSISSEVRLLLERGISDSAMLPKGTQNREEDEMEGSQRYRRELHCVAEGRAMARKTSQARQDDVGEDIEYGKGRPGYDIGMSLLAVCQCGHRANLNNGGCGIALIGTLTKRERWTCTGCFAWSSDMNAMKCDLCHRARAFPSTPRSKHTTALRGIDRNLHGVCLGIEAVTYDYRTDHLARARTSTASAPIAPTAVIETTGTTASVPSTTKAAPSPSAAATSNHISVTRSDFDNDSANSTSIRAPAAPSREKYAGGVLPPSESGPAAGFTDKSTSDGFSSTGIDMSSTSPGQSAAREYMVSNPSTATVSGGHTADGEVATYTARTERISVPSTHSKSVHSSTNCLTVVASAPPISSPGTIANATMSTPSAPPAPSSTCGQWSQQPAGHLVTPASQAVSAPVLASTPAANIVPEAAATIAAPSASGSVIVAEAISSPVSAIGAVGGNAVGTSAAPAPTVGPAAAAAAHRTALAGTHGAAFSPHSSTGAMPSHTAGATKPSPTSLFSFGGASTGTSPSSDIFTATARPPPATAPAAVNLPNTGINIVLSGFTFRGNGDGDGSMNPDATGATGGAPPAGGTTMETQPLLAPAEASRIAFASTTTSLFRFGDAPSKPGLSSPVALLPQQQATPTTSLAGSQLFQPTKLSTAVQLPTAQPATQSAVRHPSIFGGFNAFGNSLTVTAFGPTSKSAESSSNNRPPQGSDSERPQRKRRLARPNTLGTRNGVSSNTQSSDSMKTSGSNLSGNLATSGAPSSAFFAPPGYVLSTPGLQQSSSTPVYNFAASVSGRTPLVGAAGTAFGGLVAPGAAPQVAPGFGFSNAVVPSHVKPGSSHTSASPVVLPQVGPHRGGSTRAFSIGGVGSGQARHGNARERRMIRAKRPKQKKTLSCRRAVSGPRSS